MVKGWKTIILPEVIYKVVKIYADKERRAMWQVVASALSTYICFSEKIDKKMWYIFKLLNSYAELKTAIRLTRMDILDKKSAIVFVKSCLNKFKKTCWQVQSRLRIKTEHLVALVEEDLERVNYTYHGKSVKQWNDEVKVIIKNILVSKI